MTKKKRRTKIKSHKLSSNSNAVDVGTGAAAAVAALLAASLTLHVCARAYGLRVVLLCLLPYTYRVLVILYVFTANNI